MNKHVIDRLRRLMRIATGGLRRVHGDQRGTISIFTVFALLMFTMILIMIVNIGRHVDDKVKMQNAADAATYSGGVVLARGMNGVAFTNHLLCDVFAITAYLREGRDRNAEQMIPEILQAWNEAGEIFSTAQFEKFRRLGPAIIDKVPKEQEAVTAFGEMTAASSEFALPVFEHILGPPSQTPDLDEDGSGDGPLNPGEDDSGLSEGDDQFAGGQSGHLIPEFQRAMVRMIPEMAQEVTREIARRHGMPRGEETGSQGYLSQTSRGEQSGALWRTTVETVGYSNEDDPLRRTLPVIDPDPNEGDLYVPSIEEYRDESRNRRRILARAYLQGWNNQKLSLFRAEAKMSQFFNLWVTATCAQLNRLLEEEYRDTNLPMMLRRTDDNRNVERIISDAETVIGQDGRRVRMDRRTDRGFEFVNNRVRSSFSTVDDYIERDFNFVGVVSRRQLAEMGPGLFKNPIEQRSDAHTFAQVSIFIPRPRYYLWYVGRGQSGQAGAESFDLGGTFGFDSELNTPARPGQSGIPNPGQPPAEEDQRWIHENWPANWDLFNQNWTVKLVPATAQNMLDILQRHPAGESTDLIRPYFRQVTGRDLKSLNNH